MNSVPEALRAGRPGFEFRHEHTYISSPECWNVLYPSTPTFGKLDLKLGNQLQFKCDRIERILKCCNANLQKVCGDNATQHGESEKSIISLSSRNGDRTLQY
jgi:hypothetical protein